MHYSENRIVAEEGAKDFLEGYFHKNVISLTHFQPKMLRPMYSCLHNEVKNISPSPPPPPPPTHPPKNNNNREQSDQIECGSWEDGFIFNKA